MEWISVRECLPHFKGKYKKDGDHYYRDSPNVLCVIQQDGGKRFVKEGKLREMIFECEPALTYWVIPGQIDNVTHWMPLPEPPSKKQLSKEEKAKQVLTSCGILDEDGNIVDAYKDILIKKTN